MNTRRINLIGALLMSAMALTACGGKKKAPPKAKVTGPAPAPKADTDDYIYRQIIPQLQQRYGNVNFLRETAYPGGRIPPGEISWANLYQAHIQKMVAACHCTIDYNQNYMTQFDPYAQQQSSSIRNDRISVSPFGTLDYDYFQNTFVREYYAEWMNSQVWFSNFGSYYVDNFYTVFNQLMTTNNNFYGNLGQYGQQTGNYYGQQYHMSGANVGQWDPNYYDPYGYYSGSGSQYGAQGFLNYGAYGSQGNIGGYYSGSGDGYNLNIGGQFGYGSPSGYY